MSDTVAARGTDDEGQLLHGEDAGGCVADVFPQSLILTGAPGAQRLGEMLGCPGSIDPYRFLVELSSLPLGGTFVTRIDSGAMMIDRARFPLGDTALHFLFVVDGVVEVSTAGSVLEADAGACVLLPGGQRYRLRMCRGLRAYLVSMDRASLEDLLPSESFSMAALARDSVLRDPCRAFVAELHEQRRLLTGVALYAAERIAHELLATYLLDTIGFSGPVNGSNETIRERAIAHIALVKHDPEFGIDELAGAMNVSVRHLQRIFQAAGTTVSAEIRRQRAWAAHMVLNQAKYDVLSVEQVAERTGFTSAKELRRAVAQHFGLTPREIRRMRGGPRLRSVD